MGANQVPSPTPASQGEKLTLSKRDTESKQLRTSASPPSCWWVSSQAAQDTVREVSWDSLSLTGLCPSTFHMEARRGLSSVAAAHSNPPKVFFPFPSSGLPAPGMKAPSPQSGK